MNTMNQPANDTATPRTDSTARAIGRTIARLSGGEISLMAAASLIEDMLEDARQLERELSQAKERIAKLEGALRDLIDLPDDRPLSDRELKTWNDAGRTLLNQPTP